MEAHINQLVEDKQKMSDEIKALRENVDYFHHQARQRRGEDRETGWDTSDNEEEGVPGASETMTSAMSAPERGKDIMGHNTPIGSPTLCHGEDVAGSRKPITGAEGIEMLTAAATPRQPPSSTSPATFIPDGNTDPKRPQGTPDSQVGRNITRFSHLSSFPPNPQGLARSVRSRVETNFHQDDGGVFAASAAPAEVPRSILSRPLPSSFQAPFISTFHRPSRPAVLSPPLPFTTFRTQPSTPSTPPSRPRSAHYELGIQCHITRLRQEDRVG